MLRKSRQTSTFREFYSTQNIYKSSLRTIDQDVFYQTYHIFNVNVQTVARLTKI